MASLKELYELQELDWALAEKRERLDAVRGEISDESALVRARQRFARIAAQFTRQSALLRDAQLVVEQLEERERGVNERLYSGAVTNPRELGAFQDEQGMLRRQIGEAEDTLLEHMVAAEELQGTRESAEQAVAAIEGRRRQRVPVLRDQEVSLDAEIAALTLRRSETLPLFDLQMLSMYETLLANRGGHAVSKVELSRGLEICGACRIALPRSDTQRVRSGTALTQCNSCRRILYLE